MKNRTVAKKVVSIVLGLVLVLGLVVPVAAANFEIGAFAIADNEPLAVEASVHIGLPINIYTFPVGTTITTHERGGEPDEDGWRSDISILIGENTTRDYEFNLWLKNWAFDSELVEWSNDGYSATFTNLGLFVWGIHRSAINIITGDAANGSEEQFLVNIVGDTPLPPEPTPDPTPRPEGQLGVTINGVEQNFNPPPQEIGGRMMLPFRAIGEALGMTVRSLGGGVVSLTAPGIEVTHVAGTEQITVNGAVQTFPGMASVVDGGRTLMSVRMVAAAIGADIRWDRPTLTAVITTN